MELVVHTVHAAMEEEKLAGDDERKKQTAKVLANTRPKTNLAPKPKSLVALVSALLAVGTIVKEEL